MRRARPRKRTLAGLATAGLGGLAALDVADRRRIAADPFGEGVLGAVLRQVGARPARLRHA